MEQRAIVELVSLTTEPLAEPVPEDGNFEVRVRVEREANMDLVRPLDPSFAKWEERPDDEQRARLLLQTIRSQLAIGLGDL